MLVCSVFCLHLEGRHFSVSMYMLLQKKELVILDRSVGFCVCYKPGSILDT